MVNISAETITPLFQEHLQQGGRAGGEEEGGGRGRGGVAGWGGRGGAQRQFSIFASPPLHHTALVIASCWSPSNLASLVPAVSRQPDLRP